MNRRHFLFTALGAPVLAATKKPAPVERPNIVLILAEDLGAYMLGCYGNSEVHTPHIDRLAQTGVRFAAHFSAIAAAFDPAPLSAAGYSSEHAPAPAQAAGFLDAQAPGQPFLLTVGFPSPASTAPSQKNLDLYADTGFESVGWESTALHATHKDMLRNVQANLRKYAASLTTLDEQLLALDAKLQQRADVANTLVIFTSRGGYLLGHHGLWGGAAASNPPNLYEEVVKTPLIWSWPSRFPPQTVRNDVVNAYDLLPTLCELLGVSPPAASSGQSYLPFVFGHGMPKKRSWTDIAFGRFEDTEMARDDRYKLILRNQAKGPNEFYDETADLREFNNEFDNPRFANKRERLSAQLTAWRAQPAQSAR